MCLLINALSAHMVHINQNFIFCAHVEHSPTKTNCMKYYMENAHMHAHTHTHTHTHTLWQTHTHTHTHTGKNMSTPTHTLHQKSFEKMGSTGPLTSYKAIKAGKWLTGYPQGRVTSPWCKPCSVKGNSKQSSSMDPMDSGFCCCCCCLFFKHIQKHTANNNNKTKHSQRLVSQFMVWFLDKASIYTGYCHFFSCFFLLFSFFLFLLFPSL